MADEQMKVTETAEFKAAREAFEKASDAYVGAEALRVAARKRQAECAAALQACVANMVMANAKRIAEPIAPPAEETESPS